jgi:hypothetical protein
MKRTALWILRIFATFIGICLCVGTVIGVFFINVVANAIWIGLDPNKLCKNEIRTNISEDEDMKI